LDSFKQSTKLLAKVARCRFFLGSITAALAAVQEAVLLNPKDPDICHLRTSLLDVQHRTSAFTDACTHKRWRLAKTAYEECLEVYVEEGVEAPEEVHCWGVELHIVDAAWEQADIKIRYAAQHICARPTIKLAGVRQNNSIQASSINRKFAS
jgi:DnaJ family protein C protein 7